MYRHSSGAPEDSRMLLDMAFLASNCAAFRNQSVVELELVRVPTISAASRVRPSVVRDPTAMPRAKLVSLPAPKLNVKGKKFQGSKAFTTIQ